MRPGGGRAKGAAFEREVVARLQSVYPMARRRAMQARGGHEGADIDQTGVWWFECGHGKRMNAADKYGQAVVDSKRNEECGLPQCHEMRVAAITRRDRGPTLVTLSLDDFLHLIERTKT